MFRLLALNVAYLAYLLSTVVDSECQQHHVQHGRCSYTFILPEVDHCQPSNDFQVSNTLQRDSPPEASTDASQSTVDRTQKERPSWQERKLESLESAMENNTQWLQKVKQLSYGTETSLVSIDFTEIPKMTKHNQIQPSNLCWPSFIYRGFLDACCIWLQDFAGLCMNVFLFQSSGTAELPVACKPEKTRWNVCSNQTVNLLYALSPHATTWMMLLIREIHNLVFSAQGRTKN